VISQTNVATVWQKFVYTTPVYEKGCEIKAQTIDIIKIDNIICFGYQI
jgi:hypothetical protein